MSDATNEQIAKRLEDVADHGSGKAMPELLRLAADRLRETMGEPDADEIELERDQLRATLARLRSIVLPLLDELFGDESETEGSPAVALRLAQARMAAMEHKWLGDRLVVEAMRELFTNADE